MRQSSRASMLTQLFLVSAWALFLEIWLIRWISTEIRIFAYVNNLVLLACFLGLGAGYAFPKEKPRLAPMFIVLSVLVISVHAWPFRMITDLLSVFSDTIIWFNPGHHGSVESVIQGSCLTICMFGMIAAVFFPIGAFLGGLFNSCSNTIFAYSLNIIGSILGIWLFAGISFLTTPPLFWFLLACIPPLFLLSDDPQGKIWFALMLVFCSVIMSIDPSAKEQIYWSPYQKLTVTPILANGVPDGFRVNVNNVGYMALLDLSKDFVQKNFGNRAEVMRYYAHNQYELPYLLKQDAKNVLIVGAGGGNDVAAALRNGIEQIDAVEIDPVIYKIGKLFHPEKPYSSDRVHVTIEDARSFFRSINSKKKYDLIIFGLLDAHSLNSSYNNIRLDHYVYTEESLKQAKALLNLGGMLSLTFDARRPWISSRICGLLTKVFGQKPLTCQFRPPLPVFGWGGEFFVESLDPKSLQTAIQAIPELQQVLRVASNTSTPVRLSTDDWPYLYLEKPMIPSMYLFVLGSLALLFVGASRFVFRGGKGTRLHFFSLGVAFMLLEFQNISKSSLLFGATWLVNAYTITTILLLILCANCIASFVKKINIPSVYSLLFLSIATIYFLPTMAMQTDAPFRDGLLICGLYNLPVLFSSIIFIDSFNRTPEKSAALGANLLGASLGGMLESLSFVTGIRTLILVVGLGYLCSLLAKRPIRANR